MPKKKLLARDRDPSMSPTARASPGSVDVAPPMKGIPVDPFRAPYDEPTGRGRHRRRDADHRRQTVAVGYLRRSTDRQDQSIPDQQHAIEVYCAEMGLRLSRFYTDDAISGTSSVNRKGFQDMMASAQSEQCDFGVIVVYDVKRFGRVDNDEAGYYRHLLRQHGVEVRYVSEGFTGDATDDLMRPVKQWQARQESKDLSKVTIRGLLSKSTTGHWMGGAPPFGYDLKYTSQSGQFLFVLRYNADGTKGMLNENGKLIRTLERGESVAVSRRDHCTLLPGEDVRVKTVRRVFRLYIEEGRGFKAIADMFNREGVVPARGPAWAPHYSGQWSMTTVRAIIVNPAYCGDMVWNRRTDARFHKISKGRAVERKDAHSRRLEANLESDWSVVKDAHPPLVTRRTWLMAQTMLESKVESESQRGRDPRTGAAAARNGVLPEPRSHRRGSQHAGDCAGPRSKFLLSKLVACAKCGSRYEGFTQRSRSKDENGECRKSLFYACGGYIRRGKSVCQLGQVPMADLDGAVISAVLEYYERYEGIRGQAAIAAEVEGAVGIESVELKDRQAQLDKEARRIEAVERRLIDNLTPGTRDALERRLAELAADRVALDRDIEKLKQVQLSASGIKALVAEARAFVSRSATLLQSGGLSSRRVAIQRCVERVQYDQGKQSAIVQVRVVPLVLASDIECTAITRAV